MEATQQAAASQGAGQRQQPGQTGGVNLSDLERVACALGGGALALYGLSRRSVGGAALAALGGALVLRGATGHCPVYRAVGATSAPPGPGIHVEETVTINRPREDLFRFWRQLDNLPRFMKHLLSVDVLDDTHSRWTATAPAGQTVSWNAEIVAEKKNALLSWRSVEGSDIENRGSVRFVKAAAERGTEVWLTLEYHPPAGALGAIIAKLFGEEPEQQVRDDLKRFKSLMETGEIPTTKGQPRGR